MENMPNVCKCHHHNVTPVLVILFGLTFLLGNWGTLSSDTVGIVWPVLVIVAGLIIFSGSSALSPFIYALG